MNLLLDNIVFNQQKAGGISLLWSEIIKYILEHNIKCLFVEYEGNQVNVYRQTLDLNNLILKKFKYNKILSLLPRINNNYLNARYVCLSSDYNITISKKVQNVVVVHDIINELYEKRVFIRWFKKYYKKRAVSYADAVICVCENTRKDLMTLYPDIEKNKVYVVHNCVSDDYKVLDKVKTDNTLFQNTPYVIFIGRRKGYKNFNTVVDALQIYKNINFVIIGSGKLSLKETINLNKKIGEKRYIHYIGIDNKKLNILYNNAYSLIYPSEYEGFGIPIIEAQSAGCPVITSNKSSLPEVGGSGCIYIDNITPESIYSALKKLEDIYFRDQLIEAGLINSKKFTPEKTANEYINICRLVWNNQYNS